MIKIKLQKTVALGLVVIMFSSLVLISFPKKVYAAYSAVLNPNVIVAITGAIAAGLFLSDRINGSVKLTQDNINAITTIVMAEFEASGSKDKLIAQANALGDAIASGASNTAIQALASGSVIYAFAKAISQTIFTGNYTHGSSDISSKRGWSPFPYSYYYDLSGNLIILESKFTSLVDKSIVFGGYSANTFTSSSWSSYAYCKDTYLTDSSINPSNILVSVYDSNDNCISRSNPICFSNLYINGGDVFGFSSASLSFLNTGNYDGSLTSVLNPDVSHLSDSVSLTLPASVPSGLSNTVSTWDGTSDFVYSPGTDTALSPTDTVDVSPTYTGPDVIDTPVNPPSEEEGLKLPWIETILKAIGVPDTNIADTVTGVETITGKVIDGLKDIDTDIEKGIADVLPGIDSITTKTGEIDKAIDDALASVDDFLAVPDDVSFTADITNILTGKLQIIPQINTALGKLNVATRPLIIYYPFLDGTTKEINLNWYEPMREQVKTGLGLVFQVMTFLTCFAFISNVFGMGIRVGTKETYSDRPDERRK